MTHEQLMLEQMTLEKESLQAGVDRYRRGLAIMGEAESIPGMRLMKATLPQFTSTIKSWVDEVEAGNAHKGLAVFHFIKQFEPDFLAYTTVRAALNSIAGRGSKTALALGLAANLENSLSHDKLKVENPKLYRKYLERMAKSGPTQRVLFLRKQMAYAGLTVVKWGVSERARLGATLLEMLLQSCDLFEEVLQSSRSVPRLVFTQAAQKYLTDSHNRCELMFPMHGPMVVKPRPWTNPHNGGYLTYHIGMVKSQNKAYQNELKSWDMPLVYRAVNALQDTQWGVNGAILRLMKEVWDGGGRLGGLPPREDIPLPDYPRPYEDMTEEERHPVKCARAKVREENYRLMAKRMAMINRLALAEKFEKYEAIYFPHSLDWRGRVYPASGYMHPQSEDSGKALLQFTEGKPLGENGPYWLAVHLANTFGVDKVSFAERVQWVQENHDKILESAMNPLDGSRWWADADSPWMFLAAALEWLGYSLQGPGFVSHIPVSWDGSCNGLQHFSAMLRDFKGGTATNLVPSESPADVYSEVAHAAQLKVTRDMALGNEQAALWDGKVTRKIAKRNTMTMPYGSGQYGFRNQLEEELRKMWYENGKRYLDGGDDFHASLYLAGVMYESISEVVVAARQAMDWLRDCARVLAKENMPLSWVTPAGLLVLQDYREKVGQKFSCTVLGRTIKMTVNVTGTKLHKMKQSQGISPNFVHSMDAAHMMLTVNACLDQGIASFAMIHDSYGTHAADAEALSATLREQFVAQYAEHNVLEELREGMLDRLPEGRRKELPTVPPMGTLDLEAVKQSEYFFA